MIKKIKNIINRRGKAKKCSVCGNSMAHFEDIENHKKNNSEFLKKLDVVGMQTTNFRCVFCGSNNRLRLLFLFFDKLGLWQTFTNASILHIAPESQLCRKIISLNVGNYIVGDLNPNRYNNLSDCNIKIQEIDATDIQYPSEKFDIILFSHILEHIPEDKKALNELYRVLKKDGYIIIQTPYSKFLKHSFFDENIRTEEDRLYFYGLHDHVKLFSEQDLIKSITDAGFLPKIKKTTDYFSEAEMLSYGLERNEDLLMFTK